MSRPCPEFPRPPSKADLIHDPSAATNFEYLKASIVARDLDAEAAA